MATTTSDNLGLTLEDNDEFIGIEVTAENFRKIDQKFGEVEKELSNANATVSVIIKKNGDTVSTSKTFAALTREAEQGNAIIATLFDGEEKKGQFALTLQTDSNINFSGWSGGKLWLITGTASGWSVADLEPTPTEEGKGLSANDYTDEEKKKLSGIATGANNYSLSTASSDTLGGVKVGDGLKISAKGVLEAKVKTVDGVVTKSGANAVSSAGIYSFVTEKIQDAFYIDSEGAAS